MPKNKPKKGKGKGFRNGLVNELTKGKLFFLVMIFLQVSIMVL